MLKRLIKIPIAIIFIVSCFTVIIPLTYWIINGEDYVEDWMNKIRDL